MNTQTSLKRSLSLAMITFFGLGNIRVPLNNADISLRDLKRAATGVLRSEWPSPSQEAQSFRSCSRP